MAALPLPQCADTVLMVRPAAFRFNDETASSNRFQQRDQEPVIAAASAARAEFDRMVVALRGEGVRVCVVEDTPEPVKPDAVFPNNWVSFHADGTVVLYPMAVPTRRRERRSDVLDAVVADSGFRVRTLVDLTHHEAEGRSLEGTGSLVLDHVHRIAYACRSSRTHPDVVAEWAGALGYEAVLFDAAHPGGAPVYHTNVLLSIGAQYAAVGADWIAAADRGRVLGRLAAGGREVVALRGEDVLRFAGNALELAAWDEALGDCRVLVLSGTAHAGLDATTRARLGACTDTLLPVPVPTIERLGGGSVRCMMAEVFV